jgi:hypothetical protein
MQTSFFSHIVLMFFSFFSQQQCSFAAYTAQADVPQSFFSRLQACDCFIQQTFAHDAVTQILCV